MEGLQGTAIRWAVRDPGCPQAPVLDRARRLRPWWGVAPAGGSGHDHPYRDGHWLSSRPRGVSPADWSLLAGAGARISSTRSRPWCTERVPGTSRTSQIPPISAQASSALLRL